MVLLHADVRVDTLVHCVEKKTQMPQSQSLLLAGVPEARVAQVRQTRRLGITWTKHD